MQRADIGHRPVARAQAARPIVASRRPVAELAAPQHIVEDFVLRAARGQQAGRVVHQLGDDWHCWRSAAGPAPHSMMPWRIDASIAAISSARRDNSGFRLGQRR